MAGTKRAASREPEVEELPRPKKRRMYQDFGFTIEVNVGKGDDARLLVVHEDIIRARSPYFDAKMERWNKNDEEVEIEDHLPETFNTYLQILYGQPMQLAQDWYEALQSLTRTHVLAEFLGDLTSANIAIDRFSSYCSEHDLVPDSDIVREAWDLTPPNAPLRRLLIDLYTIDLDLEELAEMLEHPTLPRDFVCKVGQVLARQVAGMIRQQKAGEELDKHYSHNVNMPKCKYHQHDGMHPFCKGGGPRKEERDKMIGAEKGAEMIVIDG